MRMRTAAMKGETHLNQRYKLGTGAKTSSFTHEIGVQLWTDLREWRMDTEEKSIKSFPEFSKDERYSKCYNKKIMP